jgi:hypothetical protein
VREEGERKVTEVRKEKRWKKCECLEGMMINYMCPLDWIKRFSDNWPTFLGESLRMFPKEISI